jgi:hypothetical protein
VRLEGLGKLKKSTSSGLESATFRLIAWCLNQLRYRVPHRIHRFYNITYLVEALCDRQNQSAFSRNLGSGLRLGIYSLAGQLAEPRVRNCSTDGREYMRCQEPKVPCDRCL